ncbi:MAG: radical SAM protein [Desulfamplus sp.]|nr:radical SAM protein [Desulfamplus sp.]
MKIFLVNPACLDQRITDDDATATPMGIYSIGALMIDKGFDIKIVNLASKSSISLKSKGEPQKVAIDYLLQIAEVEQPDIVGFSVMNANRHSAIDGATALKKRLPNLQIIFGGPAPTFMPQYFFNGCPALDYIVKGEGELTFFELVSCLKKHKHTKNIEPKEIEKIDGLIFRSTSQSLFETQSRGLITDLDLLPHPAKYFAFQHISLSRGCPGTCTFCGSPDFWGTKRVRFHSAKWFVDEMEFLVNRGVVHFFVSDDTFTMKRELVVEVCDLIIDRFISQGIKITWSAISRVDFIDENILLKMRKAGCIQISFGVESGSEKIRKNLGKHFKNETIIKAFKLTAQFGILPRAYFIYGSPEETEETINQSIELMLQIEPLSMVSYMLVLFAGTSLYKNLINSLVNIKNFDPNNIWSQKIEDIAWFEVDPNLNFEQVKSFGKRLREAFYSNVHNFALNVRLVDNKELYPYHADFLSRLAMTFSHGDYSANSKLHGANVKNQDSTARVLYERAISYYPDARAYLGLSMLMQKGRNFNGAVEIIKEALKKIPKIDSKANIFDKQQLTLSMAVSLMNMARFKEALDYLEPFKESDEIKPYISACISRL